MATVREIYQYLDGLAPFSLQMEFDNAGFLSESGAALRLENGDCTEETMRGVLLDFLEHPDAWLARAAAAAALGNPGAADRMLDRIKAGLEAEV